jgi:8-oxo-dGTP pyrophosphatase MutT (NUDIX family)
MLSWLTRFIERTPFLHRVAVAIWRLFPARLAGFLKGALTRSWVVGVVAVVVEENGESTEVLLAEHSYRRTGPWGLLGGSLESIPGNPTGPNPEPSPDDVIEAALHREIEEEIGIDLTIERLLRIDAIPFMPEEPGPYRLTFYFKCTPTAGFEALREGLISGQIQPRSPEITNMRFVPLADLADYDLFSSDRRFLTQDLMRLLEPVTS